MSFVDLVIVAFGLSMDAFAVAICKGLSVRKATIKHSAITGAWFGGFQGMMPVIGYLFGVNFRNLIMQWDHWLAFGLLALIGGNMIREAIQSEECPIGDFSPRSMFPLAVATSIDALAVGITMAFLEVDIVTAAATIAIITFFTSAVGVQIGNKFGEKSQRPAQIIGGIILVAMGTKILIEHLLEHGFLAH